MSDIAEYPDLDLYAEAYWDGGDDPDEDYLECCLCTHVMNDECGIGEYDYFGPGQHACVCCTRNDPDPNEEQPIFEAAAPSADRDGEG